MAPFDMIASFGTWGAWLVYLAIGFGFGFILESSGFGDARKLTGQFYFRDLTVLKVMFTGIAVASLLTFFATGMGWLDFDQVWVNPTFLPSVALGGLLFGMGFVVGGYCPGTSLVSAATLKVDGLLFVVGVALGVFLFGETADLFTSFMSAGDLGRFTLPDLLGVSTGTAVILIVALALAMFWSFSRIRAALGHGGGHTSRRALAGAGALVTAALAVALVGQPTPDEKWDKLAAKHGSKLATRAVYIDPAELAVLMADDEVKLVVLDVRSESDWNLFHLVDAERVDLDELTRWRERLARLPETAVVVLAGNDEGASTLAWKRLMTMGAPNAYILAGGINAWLETYAATEHTEAEPVATVTVARAASGARDAEPTGALDPARALDTPSRTRPSHSPNPSAVVPALDERQGDDTLRWRFAAALGDRHPAAKVDLHHGPKIPYEAKVKLQKKVKKAGGCG